MAGGFQITTLSEGQYFSEKVDINSLFNLNLSRRVLASIVINIDPDSNKGSISLSEVLASSTSIMSRSYHGEFTRISSKKDKSHRYLADLDLIEEEFRQNKEESPELYHRYEKIVFSVYTDGDSFNIKGMVELESGKKQTSFTGNLLKLEDINAAFPETRDTNYSWKQFRSEVLKDIEKPRKYLYRGQSSNSHPLVSSFHRQKRFSLYNYYLQMIEVERNISKYLGRKFDLTDNDEYGEFMFLAQHYGYPTPLLDWTLSPFVAAYFAFSGIKPGKLQDKDYGNKRVRVFVLDEGALMSMSRVNLHSLKTGVTPIFVSNFRITHNDRAGPQQGISLFSAISNLDSYFSLMSSHKSGVLKYYDIKYSERDKAIADLIAMGITNESLFPGLEGAFIAQKEKNFG